MTILPRLLVVVLLFGSTAQAGTGPAPYLASPYIPPELINNPVPAKTDQPGSI